MQFRPIAAFCYYFSLLTLPLIFILNAFLFDENAVQGGGGVICPSPLILLSGLDRELPGMGSCSTEQNILKHSIEYGTREGREIQAET